jgi:hypothetical protein
VRCIFPPGRRVAAYARSPEQHERRFARLSVLGTFHVTVGLPLGWAPCRTARLCARRIAR